MRIISFILTISIYLFAISCNNEKGEIKKVNKKFYIIKENEFSEVQNLDKYKKTTFLPALNSEFDTDKNAIYAASFAMAWNEILNIIAEPITNVQNQDIELLTNYNYHDKVLSKYEYKTSIEIDSNTIKAKAYFNKSLPFIKPLVKNRKKLNFNNSKVTSFGFYGKCDFVEILYFNNDDDFAIKINPKDKEHEIVLMKSEFDKKVNHHKLCKKLLTKDSVFQQNRRGNNVWKYNLQYYDEVKIPRISFNIETNYSKIEGSKLETRVLLHTITRAYQKTAFILNEKGSKVESYAEIVDSTATEEIMIEMEQPKPKKMFFNKPFVIFLKRKDAQYPYFASFIANNELMETAL